MIAQILAPLRAKTFANLWNRLRKSLELHPRTVRVLVLAGLIGCAQGVDGIIRTCVISDTNRGTLEGHWPLTPIPIAISTVNLPEADRIIVSQAADTWNRFYGASKGFQVIAYGTPSNLNLSSTPQTGSICPTSGSAGFIQNGQFTRNVVVYAATNWGGDPSVIAQTVRCLDGYGQDGLAVFGGAMIQVNYQNFFIPGKRPDLASIVSHELGHLLGLGHSCEFSTRPNVPNCQNELSNALVSRALMFPNFSIDPTTGVGEIRRNLNANDMGRANCLYGNQ